MYDNVISSKHETLCTCLICILKSIGIYYWHLSPRSWIIWIWRYCEGFSGIDNNLWVVDPRNTKNLPSLSDSCLPDSRQNDSNTEFWGRRIWKGGSPWFETLTEVETKQAYVPCITMYIIWVWMCIYIYIYTYIHTSIHPSIHPYIHTSIHPYIHTSIHPYLTWPDLT